MTTEWVSLNNKSHYSLLKGLSKGTQIASQAHKMGQKAIALTDDGVLSGIPSFIKACKDKDKGIDVKSINGITFTLTDNSTISLLAKNLAGWKKLIKLTSLSNKVEKLIDGEPRLSLDDFKDIGDDIIAYSGNLGSALYRSMFVDSNLSFLAQSYADSKLLVKDSWKKDTNNILDCYQNIFGKQNFYVQIEAMDETNVPSMSIVNKALRYLAKAKGIKTFATAPTYYPNKSDAQDQRILLATDRKTTLSNLESVITNSQDVYDLRFLRGNSYYYPDISELSALHSEEELKNTIEIAERCEAYKIFSNPRIPNFDCGGLSQEEYLRQQCRNGWAERIMGYIPKGEQGKYVDRIKRELDVINGASLAGYFLIVQDVCNFAKSNGWMMAPGRGSGGGCLISYLTKITELDPVYWDLSFERFYNIGRNSLGNISLPDIDCDFPAEHREKVIEYIREKYGRDKVAQMITYSTIQGRGALKDVLRAHGACSFDLMNKITEHIPDKDKISDQLQLMREENDGEASIIQWTLENNDKKLNQYCRLGENGEYEGDFARYFAQASRLEGVKKSQGKHPSGIAISAEPLDEIVPMTHDKSTGLSVAGFEMFDLEKVGVVKLDILATTILDKLMYSNTLLAQTSEEE